MACMWHQHKQTMPSCAALIKGDVLLVVRPALCSMDRSRDKADGYCGGDWLMSCEVNRKAAINHPNVNHGSVDFKAVKTQRKQKTAAR